MRHLSASARGLSESFRCGRSSLSTQIPNLIRSLAGLSSGTGGAFALAHSVVMSPAKTGAEMEDRARATQRREASHEVLPSLLSQIEPAAVNVHGRTRGQLACLKGPGGPGAHTPDSEPVKRH